MDLGRIAGAWLSPAQKKHLKHAWSAWRLRYVRRFRSYGPPELVAALRALGLAPGDSVLVHSRLSAFNGFTGSPADIVRAFREVIGADGTLLMVSLPYRSSTLKYLEARPRFDVRRTPSQNGLLTEVFRRQTGTVRSLGPTHPVLAQGPRADSFVEGHERAQYPCGDDTPFSRLVDARAKIAFFDLPLRGFTFMHHVEHVWRDRLGFPLYEQQAYEVPVVDTKGKEHIVRVFPFSRESAARRRRGVAAKALMRTDLVSRTRVGNTSLFVVRADEVVRAGADLISRGLLFTPAPEGSERGGAR